MRRLVLALLALVPFLGSWGTFALQGNSTPYSCTGLCRTFIDDFNDGDIDGWSKPDAQDTTCTILSGSLDALDAQQSVCIYDGVGDGNQGAQPTDANEWGAMIYRNNSQNSAGIALRRKSPDADMGNTEYYYALRQGSTTFDFRVCDGESASNLEGDCQTFADELDNETPDAGDGLIFAVAGTAANTEFAVWFVDDADELFDVCSPSAWNNADYCVSSSGAIDEATLTAHCDCGVTTACVAWDNDPTDETDKDHPAAGQYSVAAYTGTSGNVYYNTFCGGTL